MQAVARALLALPVDAEAASSTARPTSASSTTWRSTRAANALPVVSLDATGCRDRSSGLGDARWVARSPGFWRILGEALHLR